VLEQAGRVTQQLQVSQAVRRTDEGLKVGAGAGLPTAAALRWVRAGV
jgi:hypothetical protein